MKVLNEVQQMMGNLQCKPEKFTGKIIFMSMFNGIGLSWGLDLNEKWHGTHHGKPDGTWNRTAEKMLQNFAGSSHPTFSCASAMEGGKLGSKGRKTEIRCTRSTGLTGDSYTTSSREGSSQ